jgi:V8-like Glu-specific endopeptidase
MKLKTAAVLALILLAAALATPPATAQDFLPPEPPKVGFSQSYEVIPNLSEAELTEGKYVWSETLNIPFAFFLKPHFVDVNLAPGDKVVVRSQSGRVVEEITGQGPRGIGTFWGLSGRGEIMTVEFHFANAYDPARPPFTIDQVIAGDVDPFGAAGPESVCGAADFEDVICYQADPVKWANVLASVGVMSVGGNPAFSLFCSGSNVSEQNAILTNDHCVGTNCLGAEFVFKYYRTGCNNGSPATMDWVSFRGDQVLANSPIASCNATASTLDFTLCSVMGDPSSQFGHVVPDPVAVTNGENLYIIQHPAGRPHEITHGGGADVSVAADGIDLFYNNTLDTEGGSSGSPVFRESDGKLVGLHHCGGCPNSGMMMSAIYPEIAPFLGSAEIFTDGFESGDTSSWSNTVP